MSRFSSIVLVALLSLLAAGCASNLSGETYSRADARAVQQVEFATVEHVRPVVIEGSHSGAGAVAGAVIGGIAGSSAGGGKGQQLATAVGAIAGALAGSKAEEAGTRAQGVEITVKTEDGRTFAVVQQASKDETFKVGDRVRVLYLNGNTRIAH
jgi:outer membrane lipoprotein SlyB